MRSIKSVFAARQRYWKGELSKHEFNVIVGRWVTEKWLPLVNKTAFEWRWLCELSAYLEFKHHGIE